MIHPDNHVWLTVLALGFYHRPDVLQDHDGMVPDISKIKEVLYNPVDSADMPVPFKLSQPAGSKGCNWFLSSTKCHAPGWSVV